MLRSRRVFVLLMCLAVTLAGAAAAWRHLGRQDAHALPSSFAAAVLEERLPSQIVAPGFVEPVTKELRLGFDISGVLDSFLVREGDAVEAGQPLVRLRQEEYTARLDETLALMRAAQADYDMHMAGPRPAEVEQARASLERAKSWLDQAEREAERRVGMVRSQSIGVEELERARRDARMAEAELQVASHTYALLKEGFRSEEISMAKQRLAAAEASVAQAKAVLDKTWLNAPVAGRILRIHTEPGEAYSIFAPMPVLSMGDTSVLNVRAEIDERDAGRVRQGQKAFVVTEAFSGRTFPGQVSRMELSMTPKRTRSGDPSEPVDRSVLEVLITLDEPGPLYSGMRVDVYIQTGGPSGPAAP